MTMRKLMQRGIFTAACAIVAVGLLGPTASAQDLLGGASEGPNNPALSVEQFTLIGPGCPARNSVRLLLEGGDTAQRLTVQFSQEQNSFALSAPILAPRTCTLAFLVSSNAVASPLGSPASGIALQRVTASIRFVNGSANGAPLTLSSGVRLDTAVAPMLSVRLPRSLTPRDIDLPFESNLRARANVRTVALSTTLSLGNGGLNGNAIRVNALRFDLGTGVPANPGDPFDFGNTGRLLGDL